ncbi:MAG: glutathione S-transferase family protein [Colwellia sp.]|nr:glutathione S-transferase family protein [Colwellia sp.]
MQLYGMGISRSFRTLWAAEETAADYDYIELDFGSSGDNGSQSKHYKKLNPQGKVPTLVDGELVICESAAILNYLAAKTPQHNLMPKDGTADRARYDEMCFFILSELEQPLWTTGKHKFAIPEQYRVPEILNKTTAFEFAKAQSALLALKGDREYAVGEYFTMADILLAQTLGWAQRFEFSIDDSLVEYKERMTKRDAFARAMKKAGK